MSQPKQNPDPTQNPGGAPGQKPQNQTGEDKGSIKSRQATDRSPHHEETSRGTQPYGQSAGGSRRT